jgi:hypothetical protein
MDRYGEMTRKLEAMGREELERTLQQARRVCSCGSCPLYVSCARENREGLFCAYGRSDRVSDGQGCACARCPVASFMGLAHSDFCRRGSEAEQRGQG